MNSSTSFVDGFRTARLAVSNHTAAPLFLIRRSGAALLDQAVRVSRRRRLVDEKRELTGLLAIVGMHEFVDRFPGQLRRVEAEETARSVGSVEDDAGGRRARDD